MKSLLVQEFVKDFHDEDALNKAITFSSDTPSPTLKKDQMLVQVMACSPSPGDVITLGGNLVLLHPKSFPFVPGMDICGKVVDSNGSDEFKVGDVVVAANGMTPFGGLAEFMAVNQSEAVLKPENVGVLEAAASASAITSRNAVMDNVKEGDRVLILGGSGGVGSATIMLAKHHAKASFVATTSTQLELCSSLGADVVVDYTKENWWERKWEQPFDKIIDCIGGGNFVDKAEKVCKAGKQGGKFLAVAGDDRKPDASTYWKAITYFATLPLRPLYTWWYSNKLPSYTLILPYGIPEGRKQVLQMMEQKTLKICLDERSPLPFTAEGGRKAFQIVASGHAHGKVVVSME